MGTKKKKEVEVTEVEQKPVRSIDKRKLSVAFLVVGLFFLVVGTAVVYSNYSKPVEITFYTMEGCSHCTLARAEIYKAYQAGYKLDVNEVNLDTEEKFQAFTDKGFYGTPVIVIPEANATLIGSNEAKQIVTILEELRPEIKKK